MENFFSIASELDDITLKLAFIWNDKVSSISSLEETKLCRDVLGPISKKTNIISNKVLSLSKILKDLKDEGLI